MHRKSYRLLIQPRFKVHIEEQNLMAKMFLHGYASTGILLLVGVLRIFNCIQFGCGTKIEHP
jgi:hypothetical protein